MQMLRKTGVMAGMANLPKMRAINMSRTNPKIREISVILLTTTVALKAFSSKSHLYLEQII